LSRAQRLYSLCHESAALLAIILNAVVHVCLVYQDIDAGRFLLHLASFILGLVGSVAFLLFALMTYLSGNAAASLHPRNSCPHPCWHMCYCPNTDPGFINAHYNDNPLDDMKQDFTCSFGREGDLCSCGPCLAPRLDPVASPGGCSIRKSRLGCVGLAFILVEFAAFGCLSFATAARAITVAVQPP